MIQCLLTRRSSTHPTWVIILALHTTSSSLELYLPPWHCSRKVHLDSHAPHSRPAYSGVLRKALPFVISTASSIIAAISILIGAAIWTSIVKKCEGINTLDLVPLNGGVVSGMIVSYGNGIYLTWAAFACLAAATVPYMVRYGSIVQSIRLKRRNLSLNQLLHIPRMSV